MQGLQPESMSPERLMNEILNSGSSSGSCRPSGMSETEGSVQSDLRMMSNVNEEHSQTMDSSEFNPGKLGLGNGDVVLLDCQSPGDFHEAHIRGAVNVTFPAIMIRRIAAGKIDLFEKSKELRAKMTNTKLTFVVYDSAVRAGLSDLVSMVAKKLAQNGCRVATLTGGLAEFRELYPEWVESNENRKTSSSALSSSSSSTSSPGLPELGEVPLLGLGSLASLRIQDETDACDSCLGLEFDDSFPVEIIPCLYLGNASISSDGSALERHNIKHILNVTPDLPNHFEDEIRYLQIPISDHWTQSMLNYFPSAINFIDEGRSKEEGVLVHCLAGISRSVTITMAYLMFKMSLSLNEAYDLVRSRKSNISPNFHFMGQLLDFERQIHSQFLSPATIGFSNCLSNSCTINGCKNNPKKCEGWKTV